MMRVLIVVHEAGSLELGDSFEFDLPEIPAKGSYISIERPDAQSPYGQDLIVREIWWRLRHPSPELAPTKGKVGELAEIFVECERAVSPYSSERWRSSLGRRARERRALWFRSSVRHVVPRDLADHAARRLVWGGLRRTPSQHPVLSLPQTRSDCR
jgi:hypothetical protein